MGWSYCHFRYFMRLLSPSCTTFTEMVVDNALIHGNQQALLRMHQTEKQVVFQLGGSDPSKLAACCKIIEEKGYSEINLNCGCPSPKVQQGNIGACLFKQPTRVAACLKAMVRHTRLPVSVKCRIGVDDVDSSQALHDFIAMCNASGVQTVYVHARKAWLQGLNPKQNRAIPPLCYQAVYDIQSAFPSMKIIINGGINTLENAQQHVAKTSGIMIGRAAYQKPLFIRQLEQQFCIKKNMDMLTIQNVVETYARYIQRIEHTQSRASAVSLVKPLQHLLTGTCMAKTWKKTLHRLCCTHKQNNLALGSGLLEAMQIAEFQHAINQAAATTNKTQNRASHLEHNKLLS